MVIAACENWTGHAYVSFFFEQKSFGYYNENLRLLQRKPQAEQYSKTYEMKSNIVRAGIEKKKKIRPRGIDNS